MNGFNKASKQYATWVDKLLIEYADRHRVEWQDRDDYITFNGSLVTFSFDHKAICRRQSALNDSSTGTVSPQFQNVGRFYNLVSRSLLGSNYARKRASQPLMIAAADINGTRISARPDTLENMHVHSLWLFPPGKSGCLNTVADRVREDIRFDFRDIDVRGIDRIRTGSECGPSQLSSYVTKFLGSNETDLRVTDDLRIYPIDTDGRRFKLP